MNSKFLCLLVPFLLAGCGQRLPKENYGNTLYYGKIKVIDTDGSDMTRDCAHRNITLDDISRERDMDYVNNQDNSSIRAQIKKNGLVISQAKFGINPLFSLHCTTALYTSFSHDTLRSIDIPSALSLPITDEISANYFGDVVITLHADGSADITHTGYTHKDLYKGPLPVSELEPIPAQGLTWQKNVRQVMNIYTP